MKRKMLFIVILIIIAGGAVMAVFFCRRNKYKDLCAYTEKLLEVKWNDCIELATGDVERKIGKEENSHVKLEVREGCEKDVLNIVRKRCGQPLDISDIIIPGYQGHLFATELKNSNIQYNFAVFLEGKIVKTRYIDIYVVYDEKNKMYIYIMG